LFKKALGGILIIVCTPLAIGNFGIASVRFPSANSGFDSSLGGVIFFMSPFILGLLVAGLKMLTRIGFKAINKQQTTSGN
jgi:hypothetical protein